MPGTAKGADGRWHKKPHYSGTYKVRAAGVRKRAYLDPTTTCRRCGLTLEARRVTHPAETWDAGHLNDGEVGGALVPEHASCNRAAGARRLRTMYSAYDW